MRLLRRTAASLALGLLIVGELPAQTPSVEEIMSKVAAHQDQAEQLRARYSYTQKVRIRALRGNGKLSREEYSLYNVAPTEQATKKELVQFKGRYEHKGRIVDYIIPGEAIPDKN